MIGVGLRSTHYPHLVEKPVTVVDWFEAVSENYMDSEGRPLRILETVREDYPVALHGVSLSIASRYSDDEPVNPSYLTRLRSLIERIEPFLVSDHLCWTGTREGNIHDLLPVPFTDEALTWIVSQIDRVQSALGRTIALENVSSYLTYEQSVYEEWDFVVEIAKRSGCKILFDINNVYVSARNHGFSAERYVDAIPAAHVGQIHLAGHTDLGTHLFDTHSRPVCAEVWGLYRRAIARMPEVPVLIEWDEDIPAFERLEAEAVHAREVLNETVGGRSRAGGVAADGRAAPVCATATKTP